ncbi:hypothetical protein ACC706_36850, partial [Rhizobium johnstonii]
MLSFIATEIHKRFPTYLSLPEGVREPTGQQIVHWFGFVAGRCSIRAMYSPNGSGRENPS